MKKGVISRTFEEAITNWLMSLLEQGKSKEEAERIFDDNIQHIMKKSIEDMADDMIDELTKTMNDALVTKRRSDEEFLLHNIEKWGKGFDAFEAMYLISVESAEKCCEHASSLPEEDKRKKHYTFTAIQHLHGRSCQMFMEILCLLRNGFADGAYARWRSLFEVTVIAQFIVEKGEEVAKAYCESIDKVSNFEWARLAFPNKSIKSSVSFKEINDVIEESSYEWYSQYKLGCKLVHGCPQGTFKRLSNYEGMSPCIPVGRSDYGLSVPAEHSAIMLSRVAINFLTIFPNMDNLVEARVMLKWTKIIQKHFYSVEYLEHGRTEFKSFAEE